MIIARTPLRMSFVGGGSDLPAYYREEPGAVVTTAIDKYIYITVNQKFDDKIRASYSITEFADHVDDLKHELIREGMKVVGIDHGIEVTSISDIPSGGTGMGSSSTYVVGLLNALYAYRGRHVGAERLAREACNIEIERCAKPIGKQDQYIAAYGGLKFIEFNPDESVCVDPIICRREVRETLENRLLLLYTGITRSADDVLREQSANTCGEKSARQGLRALVGTAHQMRDALIAGDLHGFGEMLHEAWMVKKGLASRISTDTIDDWYECARRHGAVGGKILGAGGGGFLLFYAPRDYHDEIVASLPMLKRVPIRFEAQGSKIIFVEE